jgi:hypothetical protein
VQPALEMPTSSSLNFLSLSGNFLSNTWNMVPGVIKRSKTVSSFKNAYRRHRENMVENA